MYILNFTHFKIFLWTTNDKPVNVVDNEWGINKDCQPFPRKYEQEHTEAMKEIFG